jgi:hypothetical protein
MMCVLSNTGYASAPFQAFHLVPLGFRSDEEVVIIFSQFGDEANASFFKTFHGLQDFFPLIIRCFHKKRDAALTELLSGLLSNF